MITLFPAPGPTSGFYVSQRLRLHYVDWGNRDAPLLILLHGGRDHCRNWDWVAQRLCRDFHVIAPDLRGHGDSQWSPDGHYGLAAYVYDLAQLVHQQANGPVAIVAHSLGGNIALRYAGIYPDAVARLVAIEGLGLPPKLAAARAAMSVEERFRGWIEEQRALSARLPRRYASVEEAALRMQAENARLSAEQAHHLTMHGLARNEDGSYSWKFDNHVRSISPVDVSRDDLHRLWARITCPTLLLHGQESWAANPAEDGQIGHFGNARVVSLEGAGHWLHHDRLDAFVAETRAFLTDG